MMSAPGVERLSRNFKECDLKRGLESRCIKMKEKMKGVTAALKGSSAPLIMGDYRLLSTPPLKSLSWIHGA
jgi:hypothetical protein